MFCSSLERRNSFSASRKNVSTTFEISLGESRKLFLIGLITVFFFDCSLLSFSTFFRLFRLLCICFWCEILENRGKSLKFVLQRKSNFLVNEGKTRDVCHHYFLIFFSSLLKSQHLLLQKRFWIIEWKGFEAILALWNDVLCKQTASALWFMLAKYQRGKKFFD